MNRMNVNLNENQIKIKSEVIKIPTTKHNETKIKIKKLNLKTPIEFKSQDYFNVIDYSINYLKTASNEIDRGNIKNTTQYIQQVLEYINQIK